MSGRSILLVDDNLHDLELCMAALRQLDCADRVTVLRDGAEALEHLQRCREAGSPALLPQVVLLDVKMPRLDGIEVLRAIRADPGLRLLPVVMLTSSREERDLVRSYDLGANAYVVKPVDFRAFARAIRSATEFWTGLNQAPRTTSDHPESPAHVRTIPPDSSGSG